MNYSRPLSTASVNWSQNLTSFKPQSVIRKWLMKFRSMVLDNWRRGWILALWIAAMAGLFAWKFFQYRNRAAFHVMGYCLPIAKGAAETLKLNMALILFPVCRNTLTWLRSTRARSFVPFDDNINFHKVIASAIGIGLLFHAGFHLSCDFPRIVNSPPDKFALISKEFGDKQPSYGDLMRGVEGVTGIFMVVLLAIVAPLATRRFRDNLVRLPPPFNRLTGFNAFWYSHHLTCIVYILLYFHGFFLFLDKKWYHKTVSKSLHSPPLFY